MRRRLRPQAEAETPTALSAAPPLDASTRINFAVGQIAEGIKTCSFNTFLLFYYNQVLGLNSELAGTAIALALIFDAVSDPVAGSISDRWQSRLGRRHPFMYASALPLGVSFYLLFDPLVSLSSVGQGGLFCWMLAATVLTRASMTLYHVPHLALGAELSTDYDERTSLVAARNTFGAIGYILVYAVGFGWFFAATPEHPNGQTNPDAYRGYAVVLGMLMTITILQSAWGTRQRIPWLAQVKPQAKTEVKRGRLPDVARESMATLGNPSFRWMMIGFILIVVAFGAAATLGLYCYTFFWQLDRFQILLVLVTGPVGSMLGYLVARRFFVWLDKRNAMIAGGVAWVTIHALPVMLYLAGWAPPLGSWSSALLLMLITVFAGVTIAQLFVGIGTAIADIADEIALHRGLRQEGVLFGASAFAIKCSAALGPFLAGLALAAISWPSGADVRTAADVAEPTRLALAVVWGPVSTLLAIPGLLCLRGYRLNRARLREIQAALRGAS